MQGLMRGCSVEESEGRTFGETNREFDSFIQGSKTHVPVLHLELPDKISLFFYHMETLPHFTAYDTRARARE